MLGLQSLLHMPQFMPKFWTVAVLSAVPRANSAWGMCSKHDKVHRHTPDELGCLREQLEGQCS